MTGIPTVARRPLYVVLGVATIALMLAVCVVAAHALVSLEFGHDNIVYTRRQDALSSVNALLILWITTSSVLTLLLRAMWGRWALLEAAALPGWFLAVVLALTVTAGWWCVGFLLAVLVLRIWLRPRGRYSVALGVAERRTATTEVRP